jgi:hypothetical protein
MRVFGFEIVRTKAYQDLLTSVGGRGGWFPIIGEPYTGAWQRNVELRGETLLA